MAIHVSEVTGKQKKSGAQWVYLYVEEDLKVEDWIKDEAREFIGDYHESGEYEGKKYFLRQARGKPTLCIFWSTYAGFDGGWYLSHTLGGSSLAWAMIDEAMPPQKGWLMRGRVPGIHYDTSIKTKTESAVMHEVHVVEHCLGAPCRCASSLGQCLEGGCIATASGSTRGVKQLKGHPRCNACMQGMLMEMSCSVTLSHAFEHAVDAWYKAFFVDGFCHTMGYSRSIIAGEISLHDARLKMKYGGYRSPIAQEFACNEPFTKALSDLLGIHCKKSKGKKTEEKKTEEKKTEEKKQSQASEAGKTTCLGGLLACLCCKGDKSKAKTRAIQVAPPPPKPEEPPKKSEERSTEVTRAVMPVKVETVNSEEAQRRVQQLEMIEAEIEVDKQQTKLLENELAGLKQAEIRREQKLNDVEAAYTSKMLDLETSNKQKIKENEDLMAKLLAMQQQPPATKQVEVVTVTRGAKEVAYTNIVSELENSNKLKNAEYEKLMAQLASFKQDQASVTAYEKEQLEILRKEQEVQLMALREAEMMQAKKLGEVEAGYATRLRDVETWNLQKASENERLQAQLTALKQEQAQLMAEKNEKLHNQLTDLKFHQSQVMTLKQADLQRELKLSEVEAAYARRLQELENSNMQKAIDNEQLQIQLANLKQEQAQLISLETQSLTRKIEILKQEQVQLLAVKDEKLLMAKAALEFEQEQVASLKQAEVQREMKLIDVEASYAEWLRELNASNEQKTLEIQKLEGQLMAVKQEQSQLMALENEKLQAQLRALKTEQVEVSAMKQAELERELKLSEVEASYILKFEQLDANNKEKAEEVERLKAEIMLLKQEQGKRSSAENDSLLAELAALRQEHAQLLFLKQAEVQRELKLGEVEAAYSQRFKLLETSNQQKSLEIQELQMQLGNLKNLEVSNEQKSTEIESLLLQLSALKEQQKELVQSTKQQEDELRSQSDGLKRDLVVLKENEGRLAALKQESDAKTASIEDLVAQQTALKGELSQIELLKQDNAAKSADIESLMSQLEALRQEQYKLNSELPVYQQQAAAKAADLEKLKATVTALERESTAKSLNIEALVAQLQALQQERVELSSVKQESAAKSSELEKLQAQLTDMKMAQLSQLASKEEEGKLLRAESEHMKSELSSAKKDSEKLKQLKQIEMKREIQLGEVEAAYKARSLELELGHKKKDEEIVKLQRKLTASDAEKNLQAHNRQQKEKEMKVGTQKLESEIEALKREQEQLALVKQESAAKSAELSSLTSELIAKKQELLQLSPLKQDQEVKATEIQKLQAQLAAMKQEHAQILAVKEEREELIRSESKTIQAELTVLKQDMVVMSALKQDGAAKATKIDQLQAQLESMKQSQEEMKALKDQQAKVSRSENEKLQEELRALKQEQMQTRSLMQAEQKRDLEMNELQASYAQKFHELVENAKQKTLENDALAKEIKELKRKASEFEIKDAGEQNQKQILQGVYDTQVKRIAELEGEISRERGLTGQHSRELEEMKTGHNRKLQEMEVANADHAQHRLRLEQEIVMLKQNEGRHQVKLKELEAVHAQKLKEAQMSYSSQIQNLSSDASQADVQQKLLKQQLELAAKQHQQEKAQLRQQYENELSQAEQLRAGMEAETKSLALQLQATSTKDAGQLEALRADFEARRRDLEEQLAVEVQAKALVAQEREQALQDKLAAEGQYAENVRQLEQKVMSLQQVAMREESMLQQEQAETKARSQEVQEAQLTIQELQSLLTMHEQQMKSMSQDIEDSKFTIQELQNDSVSKERKMRDMEEAYEQRRLQLEGEIARLEAELARLMEQLNAKATTRSLTAESVGWAVVKEKFTADSMDQETISLELGQRIEVVSIKGSWAVVRTESGQTGDVPVMCLNLEDVQDRSLEGEGAEMNELRAQMEALRQAYDAQLAELDAQRAELEGGLFAAQEETNALRNQLEIANAGQQEALTTRSLTATQEEVPAGSVGWAYVKEKFTADSMDQDSMSLSVGQRIEVVSMKGSWASVRLESGQIGDVPVMCLNLEDARAPSQGSTDAGLSPPPTAQVLYEAGDPSLVTSGRSLPSSDPSLLGMQYETQTYEMPQMYEVPQTGALAVERVAQYDVPQTASSLTIAGKAQVPQTTGAVYTTTYPRSTKTRMVSTSKMTSARPLTTPTQSVRSGGTAKYVGGPPSSSERRTPASSYRR